MSRLKMGLQEKLKILEKKTKRIRELARKWGLKDRNNLFVDLIRSNIEKARRTENSVYYESARNFLRDEISQIREYRAWERKYNSNSS